MPRVHELPPEETETAHLVMAELRPKFSSATRFVRQVNEIQRPEGYRLVGSFDDGVDHAVAAAGFRTGHNLVSGFYLYVDDLVTLPAFRGRGHADALMRWLFEEANRLECDQLELDSATHRHDAHRFYLKHDLVISAFHFQMGA
ncbi:MAG: GNAT family N-acetyltransferase [Actinomycetota bacterium]|nr:GNAT family N-acetyltransferase [Actinomycetota bacterium]